MTRSILGLASLALVWAFCAPISAQPREPVLAKNMLPREAIGGADSLDKAKEAALTRAHKDVVELMEAHGMTTFKVDKEYVRKHVIAPKGQPGADQPIPDGPPLKTWVVTYRSDVDWFAEIARQDRAEVRQMHVAQTMVGLSILLLAGFGYLRLDEYTNRRYTTWLRAAGLTVAGSGLAGWWLMHG